MLCPQLFPGITASALFRLLLMCRNSKSIKLQGSGLCVGNQHISGCEHWAEPTHKLSIMVSPCAFRSEVYAESTCKVGWDLDTTSQKTNQCPCVRDHVGKFVMTGSLKLPFLPIHDISCCCSSCCCHDVQYRITVGIQCMLFDQPVLYSSLHALRTVPSDMSVFLCF